MRGTGAEGGGGVIMERGGDGFSFLSKEPSREEGCHVFVVIDEITVAPE
jgi:hypothetical protein